jgi:spore germination protein YaaH
MSEQGPFDRILGPSSSNRDKTARAILVGMAILGLVLLLLVLPPISILDNSGLPGSAAANNGASGGLPNVPDGYEALSRLLRPNAGDTTGAAELTVNLVQQVSDGRNIGLYTYRDGDWERLGAATLVNNGFDAKGQVSEIPANVAVLRRTGGAAYVSGWLSSGAPADPAALGAVNVVNPVDFTPATDGSIAGTASPANAAAGATIPTVRAVESRDVDTLNAILASPELREAHINALVQLAGQPQYAGVDLDYPGVALARKPDFTGFVVTLAERLHAANRQLTITLPTPIKTGISWDTGPYDWKELALHADYIKLVPEADPSIYYQRMEEVAAFLKTNVDLKKVVLIVSRWSKEKASNGIRLLSLRDGLSLASALDVRTSTAIAPNSSVNIVGRNIYQDDGASGIRWDEKAFAVSFSYPGSGSGGQRTVWFENSLSLAFRLDFARRLGLGGVHVDDISLNPQGPSFWEPLSRYVESGRAPLSQPNGVLLRPVWNAPAGAIEPGQNGNVIWKAPAQAGVYDVSLVISDGVVRATQKVVLDVRQAQTPAPSSTGTPQPGASPTPAR